MAGLGVTRESGCYEHSKESRDEREASQDEQEERTSRDGQEGRPGGGGMKRGPGYLGERRLGIALIWFLPAGESERSAPIEGLDAEDRELVESMMGMDAEVAVGHLQALGRKYKQDPEGLRAELLSMMEGDELATKYMLEFIAKFESGDQSPPLSEDTPEETADAPGGQVLEFPGPKVDEEDEVPGERE